jgi:hypothetical protein
LALTLGDRLLVGLWELNLSSSYETLAKDETIGWPLGPKLFIKAWLNFAVLQKHDYKKLFNESKHYVGHIMYVAPT